MFSIASLLVIGALTVRISVITDSILILTDGNTLEFLVIITLLIYYWQLMKSKKVLTAGPDKWI